MDKIRIEISYEVENDDQAKAIEAFALRSAKDFLAAATLVCKRPPDVAVTNNRFFYGTEEIKVMVDDDA